MLLSVVGVWLVYGTWKQTAESADSARKTLRSYIAKERAYIGCKSLQFVKDNAREGFIVALENGGASPGTLVSVEWEYLAGPIWPDKLRFQVWDKRTLVTDAQGWTPLLTWDQSPVGMDKVWLVGIVHYLTLEEEHFQTPFCYQIYSYQVGGLSGTNWSISESVCHGKPHHT